MNILIKSATIIDSKSDYQNKTQDILVEKGVITKIAKNIKNPKNYKEIKLENLHISQGWFDSSVCFGEPGYEERETIANGLKTAASSGFTAVAVNSNTNPVIDSNSDVTFLKSKSEGNIVDLYPIGALTVDSKGVDLAELYDMQNAGAVAFNDFKKSTTNANLLKLALQYSSGFNGLICSFPQDNSIAGIGVMNEHVTSTTLGLKGIPNLSEELQIARDLFLLEYAEGKLHIPTISTAKSVELIREAKKNKLNVSCSVAIHNLFFTDEVLKDFNTNYKVLPPLRNQTDVDALIQGVKDRTIDMVTSDHNPLDIEHKKVEFDHASYGTVGLESAFGALNTIFTLKKTIEILTRGRERFDVGIDSVNVGNKLNITLYNPSLNYTFLTNDLVSKSKNTIFENQNLKGNVYGVIANNQVFINNQHD